MALWWILWLMATWKRKYLTNTKCSLQDEEDHPNAPINQPRQSGQCGSQWGLQRIHRVTFHSRIWRSLWNGRASSNCYDVLGLEIRTLKQTTLKWDTAVYLVPFTTLITSTANSYPIIYIPKSEINIHKWINK